MFARHNREEVETMHDDCERRIENQETTERRRSNSTKTNVSISLAPPFFMHCTAMKSLIYYRCSPKTQAAHTPSTVTNGFHMHLFSSQVVYLDVSRHIIRPFQDVGEHLTVPLYGDDFCSGEKECPMRGRTEEARVSSHRVLGATSFKTSRHDAEPNGCKR